MKQKLFLGILILFSVISLSGCDAGRKPYEETRFLMNTVCTISAGGENAEAAVKSAFDVLARVEKETDFYREDSAVSRFNRAKAGEPVSLGEDVFPIVKTALAISEASEGAFDITVAPLSALWPFHGEESPVPPPQESVARVLSVVGYQKLKLDSEAKTLTKTENNVQIDLGAAAKGYGADVAARAMQEQGAAYGVLNLGGNVYVFGKNPNRSDGSWQVGIQTPFAENDTYSHTVSVQDSGAVVTSGNYQRYFIHEGKLYHHILSPKTGYPAEPEFNSVTITAKDALTADCLSTACYVLGREKAESLAAQMGVGISFLP